MGNTIVVAKNLPSPTLAGEERDLNAFNPDFPLALYCGCATRLMENLGSMKTGKGHCGCNAPFQREVD